MAADKAKDELRLSKPTLALVIETAVHALTPATIELVMVTIHRVDVYRDFLRPAVERVGSTNAESVGEALTRTLVREGLGLSFHAPFASEVFKAIFRDRARTTGAYSRADFRRMFPVLAKALEREHLDVGDHGELRRAGSGGEPIVDTAWIKGLDRNELDTLRRLLREVMTAQDNSLDATSVVISRVWFIDYSLPPTPDEQVRMLEHRMSLLRTLEQRKVITGYQGQPGRVGEGGGIVVEANRHIVAETIRAMDAQLPGGQRTSVPIDPARSPLSGHPKVPPRSSLPQSQQAALPPEPALATPTSALSGPSQSSRKPIEDLGREYGRGFAAKFGEHSATAVWFLIGFVVLALLGGIGWRKQIFAFYESVVHPTAQPDTTSRK